MTRYSLCWVTVKKSDDYDTHGYENWKQTVGSILPPTK